MRKFKNCRVVNIFILYLKIVVGRVYWNRTIFVFLMMETLNPTSSYSKYFGALRWIRTTNVHPVGTDLQSVAEPPSLPLAHCYWSKRLDLNQRYYTALQAVALDLSATLTFILRF